MISIRRAQDPEHSLLIARLRDERLLRDSIERPTTNTERAGAGNILDKLDNGAAVGFLGQYVVLGPSADIRDFIREPVSDTGIDPRLSQQVTAFAPLPTKAGVMTYSDDRERVGRFVATLTRLNQSSSAAAKESSELDQLLAQLPFAATETNLTDRGFERRTRSSFGLFGFLVSLLNPESKAQKEE
jgi:hypothetical protein